MPTILTNEIITAAILGFEEQKRHIDTQLAELRDSLSGSSTATAAPTTIAKGKRRKMSAAVRRRMGEAQRKRWAESKGHSEPASETVTTKPKRKMSAAGRKAISDATKKRWAAFHAAADKPKVAAAKKAVGKKAVGKKAAKKATVKKAAKTANAAIQTVAQ